MTFDRKLSSFDVTLPNGHTVHVNIEPTRTAAEIAEAVARKAGLDITPAGVPELYLVATDHTVIGTAADLADHFRTGKEIALHGVMATPDIAQPDRLASHTPEPVATKDQVSRSTILIFCGLILLAGAILAVALISTNDKVQKPDTTRVATLLAKAKADTNRKDYRAALAVLEELLKLDPDHAGANRLRHEAQRNDPLWWLAKAESEARLISDPRWKSINLRMVAWSRAKAGDISGAQTTAEAIPGGLQKLRAYHAIAEAQAKAGDIGGAKATAESMTSGNRKWRAYVVIAAEQARAGDISGARAMAERIDARARTEAYIEIAGALAQRGDIPAAIAIVASSPDASKWEAFVAIGTMRLKVGDTAGFRENVTSAAGAAGSLDPERRCWAYLTIAELQLKGGDALGCRKTLNLVETTVASSTGWGRQSPNPRIYPCRKIGELWVRCGDTAASKRAFSRAVELANRIENAGNRASVYADIARDQAQAGLTDDSRRILGLATDVLTDNASAATSRPRPSEHIYLTIACAQLLIGDVAAAKETADRIADPATKSYALGEMIKILVDRGEIDQARTVAYGIAEPYCRSQAYCAIAQAQWAKGQVAFSRESFTLARIAAVKDERDMRLYKVVWAQAQTQQLDDIEAWVENLQGSARRCECYWATALGIMGVKPD